jgi:transcriptional regulator with XRE-family HTH domain
MERGTSEMSIKSLRKVAEALGVDLDYLFKED